MFKPSEVQILMLALTLTPLVVWTLKGIETAAEKWLVVSLLSFMTAYVLTVLEGVFLPDVLNFLEHVFYLVAAVCFMMTSIEMTRDRAASNEGSK